MQRLLIILSIVLLILVLLEGGLRLFWDYNPSVPVFKPAFQFHSRYLIELKPNVNSVFVRAESDGGDSIGWQSNNFGFRGAELLERDLRIMVYGDSNIQGRFSKLENTFCAQLEQFINTGRDSTVEVVNAGVVGFGPDQSLLKIEEEKIQFKPDIIVFHIFSENDYGDLIRNRLFELNENGQLTSTGHETTIDEQLSQATDNKVPLFKKIRLLAFTNALGRYLYNYKTEENKKEEAIQYYVNAMKEEFSVYENDLPRQFSHFADHYDFDVALFPNSKASITKIKLMKAVLKKAYESAIKDSIGFVVLIQPSSFDVALKANLTYTDFENFTEYKQDNLTRPIELICKENHIPYLNLLDVFAANDPEQLFFFDNHWSDEGQQLAAKETAKYLRQQFLE